MNRGLIAIGVIGVLLINGLAIGLAEDATSQSNATEDDVCVTSGCVDTASRVLKDLNPEVKPCDNFYEFACGGYLASEPIPEGAISVDRFVTLRKTIENQLKLRVEEPISPNEARPFQLVKGFFRTCMNTSALEETGLEPLRKILREFGGWPVLEGPDWIEADNFDWVQSVYKSRELGYSVDNFFSLGIGTNWNDNTKWMLQLDQPKFGLGRQFLIEGIDYFVVKAYYDYMVDIAVLLGADRERAALELRQSLEFEMRLANISLAEEDRRNFTLLNNPMSITQLNNRYPIVNWKEYINTLLPPTVRVTADEIVNVKEPSFISNLDQLLKDTPKEVQANYALWRVVAESAKYLTKSMRDRLAEYEAAMTSSVKTEDEPRWKQCLALVSDTVLSSGVSALYIRKYFTEEARQNVIELVADIKSELISTVEKADWMDEATRSRAMEKAVSMTSSVAYPVDLLRDEPLEKLYANFTLKNDLLGDNLNSNVMQVTYSFELLRKPVNKTDWVTHDVSTEVNAYYDPAENSIQIPASVLQGTLFSDDRPRYMNYGAIGYVLGHEMTHGFDTQGRQFDKDGKLVDWWTSETAAKYLEKAQCVIDQYNNYTVPAVGENVDGTNTLGENIADIGGVEKAYQAYKKYVERNGPEPRLPGLNYTAEQMFWISAASTWCSRYRPEQAQYELTTDEHSPERFRVIGSFSNMPIFAADFNCPVGSNMNPVHKCSVF